MLCTRDMMIAKPILQLCIAALLIVSTAASAFQMQTLQDTRSNLHDYVGDGRWTIVMFWGKDCVACEAQKPMLEAFHQKYSQSRAKAIGVSIDGMENIAYIRQNIAKHQTSYLNLAVLTDVFEWQFKQETGKQYRLTPTYLLYFPDGKLAGVRHGSMDFNVLEQILNEE